MIRNRCCNHSCRRMCCKLNHKFQLEHSMLVQLLFRKLLEHSMLVQLLHRKLLEHSRLVQLLDHNHCHNQLEHSSWLLLVHSRLAQRCIRTHDFL